MASKPPRKWKCACGRCYGQPNALLPNDLHKHAASGVDKRHPLPYVLSVLGETISTVRDDVSSATSTVRARMDAIAEVLREMPRPTQANIWQVFGAQQMEQMLTRRPGQFIPIQMWTTPWSTQSQTIASSAAGRPWWQGFLNPFLTT